MLVQDELQTSSYITQGHLTSLAPFPGLFVGIQETELCLPESKTRNDIFVVVYVCLYTALEFFRDGGRQGIATDSMFPREKPPSRLRIPRSRFCDFMTEPSLCGFLTFFLTLSGEAEQSHYCVKTEWEQARCSATGCIGLWREREETAHTHPSLLKLPRQVSVLCFPASMASWPFNKSFLLSPFCLSSP